MCLNSRNISLDSRVKYYFPGYSHISRVEVPCCECEECLMSVRNDMFIRMRSEYDDCIKNGGLVAFLTFTYRNSDVPIYSYSYNSETRDIDFKKSTSYNLSDTIFAFDKVNLQRCFNSIRKHYERLGISSPFRYCLVSEYGTDRRFTQRPHFHGLFYLSPALVSHYRMNNTFFDECKFVADFSKYWHHGIVSASKKGLFVKNDDSIGYLSKYVSKSIVLSHLRQFSRFKKFIESHLHELDPSDYKFNRSVDSYFKYYLRKCGSSLFVIKSKNFGNLPIRYFNRLIQEKKFDLLFDEYLRGFKYIKNSEVKYIPYSMYYFRKLFYYTREDGSFCLSPLGFQFREKVANDSFKDCLEIIRDIDANNLSGTEFSDFIYMFKTAQHDSEFVRDYILYSKFVRGRSFPLSIKNRLDEIFDYSHGYDTKILISYLMRCNYGYVFSYDDSLLNVIPPDIEFKDYKNSHPFKFSAPYYNNSFEYFHKCYKYLLNTSKSIKFEKNRLEFERSKLLRDVLNDFEY